MQTGGGLGLGSDDQSENQAASKTTQTTKSGQAGRSKAHQGDAISQGAPQAIGCTRAMGPARTEEPRRRSNAFTSTLVRSCSTTVICRPAPRWSCRSVRRARCSRSAAPMRRRPGRDRRHRDPDRPTQQVPGRRFAACSGTQGPRRVGPAPSEYHGRCPIR